MNHSAYTVHRYVLEPGDGTRYVFSMFPIEAKIDREPDLTLANVRHGVWFSIEMPSRSMAMTTTLPTVIDIPFVDYVHGKAPYMDRYTLCAVLLAISVLCDDVTNTDEAKKEMMRVPEILFPK